MTTRLRRHRPDMAMATTVALRAPPFAQRIHLLLAALLLACLMWPAADSRATTEVPAHIRNDVPEARLSGEGTFRWFGLKIYDAKLYVGAKGFDPAAPAANRFALDLRYGRDLIGKKIAESSIDEIRKLGIGKPAQHDAWLARMTAMFPDVRDGNRITGIYLPGQGARFYLDGKNLGEIADPEFGRAFFGIWLDPKTTAPALRERLLAGAGAP